MIVLQMVRRFGVIGGMEEYVWHLSRELVGLGVDVRVLCEEIFGEPPIGVNCVKMGAPVWKPGWWGAWWFSRRTAKWVAKHNNLKCITHSHQSLSPADIYSFHSTPHGWGEDGWKLKKLDPSWWVNQMMYKRSMGSGNFDYLVPVSKLVRDQVNIAYPAAHRRIWSPIPPGVMPPPSSFPQRAINLKNPVVGFIGKEWKRKGLPLVVEVYRSMQEQIPNAQLHIAGVAEKEIQTLISGLGGVSVVGWIREKDQFYRNIDVLFHPAKREAFGMVVTEALARGVPVLTSDQTGASEEIPGGGGEILPVVASSNEWRSALVRLLNSSSHPNYQRPWSSVAAEYNSLYEQIWNRKRGAHES